MATNTEKIVVQVVVQGQGQLDKLDKKITKALENPLAAMSKTK